MASFKKRGFADNIGAFLLGANSSPTGRGGNSSQSFGMFKRKKDYEFGLEMAKNRLLYDRQDRIYRRGRTDKKIDDAVARTAKNKEAEQKRQADYSKNVLTSIQNDLNNWVDKTGSSEKFPITYNTWEALQHPATRLTANSLFPYYMDKNTKGNKQGVNLRNAKWSNNSFKSRGILFDVKNRITYNTKVFDAVQEAIFINKNPYASKTTQENILKFKKFGIVSNESGDFIIPEKVQEIADIHNVAMLSDKGVMNSYIDLVQTEAKAVDTDSRKQQGKLIKSWVDRQNKKGRKSEGFAKQPSFTPMKKIGNVTFNDKQLDMQSFIVSNAKRIAEQNNKELGRVQIAAILSAAYYESSYNPSLLGDKTNVNKSKGLFQIKEKIHNLGENELKLYDPFVNLEMILTKVNQGALNNEKFMNATTVEEASNIFTMEIEKPNNGKQKSVQRAKFAKTIFNKNFTIIPVEEKKELKSDKEVFTNNLRKKIGVLDKIQQREEIRGIFKSPVHAIDSVSMIGNKENPVNDIVNIIVGGGIIRYGDIVNNKNLSSHEKARQIIEKHNNIVEGKKPKLSAIEKQRITKELNPTSDAMTLNGDSNFIFNGIDLPIPRIPTTDDLLNNLDRIVGTNSNLTTSDTRRKASPANRDLFILYNMETYFSSLLKQHKGKESQKWSEKLVNKLIEERFSMLSSLIKNSADAPAYHNSATWNLNSSNLKTISEYNETLGRDINSVYRLRDSRIKKELDENGMIYAIKTIEIDGTPATIYMPTGQKLSKEDKAETRFRPKVLLLPNKDNEVTSETMAYGPNGVESNNLTLSVFGELQKGDNVSDEDFEKQKQSVAKFRKYVREGLFENKDNIPNIRAAEMFFEKTQKHIEYSNVNALLSSDVIGTMVTMAFREEIERNRSPFTETVAGQDVEGTRINPSHQNITDEKVLKSMPEVKEANAIAPFATSGLETVLTLEDTFFDIGEMSIDALINKKGRYSTETKKAYTEFIQEITSDKNNTNTLRESIQNVIDNPDQYSKEKVNEARLLRKALADAGASRGSDLASIGDKFINFLSTLGDVAAVSFSTNFISKFTDGFKESSKQMDEANISNKAERIEELNKIRKDTEDRLKSVLSNNDASSQQKQLAVLNARRTFSAITLTYQFAGMIQGGSGGRAISNEDFENMYKALWSGGGAIQASQVKLVKGIVEDINTRIKIINAVKHRGSATIDAVLRKVNPMIRGYRRWRNKQDKELNLKMLGDSELTKRLVYNKNPTQAETASHSSALERTKNVFSGKILNDGSGSKLNVFEKLDKDIVMGGTISNFKDHLKSITTGIPTSRDVQIMTNKSEVNQASLQFGQMFIKNNLQPSQRPMKTMYDFAYATVLYNLGNSNMRLEEDLLKTVRKSDNNFPSNGTVSDLVRREDRNNVNKDVLEKLFLMYFKNMSKIHFDK